MSGSVLKTASEPVNRRGPAGAAIQHGILTRELPGLLGLRRKLKLSAGECEDDHG